MPPFSRLRRSDLDLNLDLGRPASVTLSAAPTVPLHSCLYGIRSVPVGACGQEHRPTMSCLFTGQITLVCIGPLTNIAVALRIDPSFGRKLRQCIIMGGNTTGNNIVFSVHAHLTLSIMINGCWMRDLHWLPIIQRIEFKLCLLVHKSLIGHSPAYVSDPLTSATDVPGRPALRTASRGDFIVPRTNRKFGNRAFCVAAPCTSVE